MRNHCVFYRTNLNYDGRVTTIIRSLATSFPSDTIYLYEYPITDDTYQNFPSNVKIRKAKLFFGTNIISHGVQILKALLYAIKSFFFLLRVRPKSIQIHHEIVEFGPLLYKLIFRNTCLVYDDKEMYYPRSNANVGILHRAEYKLVSLTDLVIVTNEYRRKALYHAHRYKIQKSLIVDNYIFESGQDLSKDIRQKISHFKQQGYKILLHQGVLAEKRGVDLITQVVNQLPKDWVLIFIGINDASFNDFLVNIPSSNKDRLYNLGYINYKEINSFYRYIDASMLFYLPSSFNNNYCAPNRLYAPANNGVPIIVNDNNFTLSQFVRKYSNGVSLDSGNDVKDFFTDFEIYKIKAQELNGKFEYHDIIPTITDFYKQECFTI